MAMTGKNLNAYTLMIVAASALVLIVAVLILLIQPQQERGQGWIGIRAFQANTQSPVVIQDVIPHGPAEAVGLQRDDIIVSYNGYSIYELNLLKYLIENSYTNQRVRLIVNRNGVNLTADTRVARHPDHIARGHSAISIPQGAQAPHKNRGQCINCHNIIPVAKYNALKGAKR
jgi:predicted metalloprotease with PDZ domain